MLAALAKFEGSVHNNSIGCRSHIIACLFPTRINPTLP
jgi:hypothetical protein